MLQRVKEDERDADDFQDAFRRQCIEAYQAYNNAQDFVGLRKKNKFPVAVIQKLVDLFRADMQDKLWYAGRPCTLIGVEDTDSEDAKVKQDFLDWQDDQDAMYRKTGTAWTDAALYRVAPAQVDYTEKTERRWVQTPIPLPALDEMGQPITDEMGNPIPLIDPMTQQTVPSGEVEWELKDITTYKGATVKRIDPMSLLWTQDKETIDDEFPIMVRSQQSKHFFDTKPYFFNQDKLEALADAGSSDNTNLPQNKRDMMGRQRDAAKSKRPCTYVEWQGLVDKQELYEYLISKQELDPSELATIKPKERVWCVCGVANGLVVNRLQADPLMLGGPNIVIGIIASDEDELSGKSLYQLAFAAHHGSQDTMGILLENFKQSVDAFWILKSGALIGKKPILNKAGTALETNEDVNTVAKRVEQPPVAKDIYTLLAMLDMEGKDTTGVKDVISGDGDPSSDTLGESQMNMVRASLRMTDYMRSFEDTFVKPLYKMRNQINANFIDEEFRYGVLGEGAMQWRPIDPAVIRAGVDFVCEASTRESNRNVLIQQMLQFIQLAPLAIQAGQPVRIDKLMAKLAETGFSWKQEEIFELLPLLRIEQQGGMDIDGMMVNNAMTMQALGRMKMLTGGGSGPGQELPQPTSEGEAVQSANARQTPQVRSVVQ